LKVLVTGGTGFVGTHLVNGLLRGGHSVAVLARHPDAARNRYNRPVESVPGNALDPASLSRACVGRDAVIHLVGVIWENGEQTFDRMHREAPANVVAAMRSAGVRRLLHMSAMGASDDAPSEYGRTKAAGERVVRESGLDWTIFRPSIVFGPGDGFVSLLAGLVRGNPGFIPVIGSGETRFMPVSIRDVVRVFLDSLEKPETIGQTYEVGGTATFTLNEIYRDIALAVGKRKKPLVHFPLWWGRFLAGRFEGAARRGWVEAPPLTRDQLRSLSRDNVGDTAKTDAVFGPATNEFRLGIREYLHPENVHDPKSGFGDEVKLEAVKVVRVR
jgi:NADH dehydrogenase